MVKEIVISKGAAGLRRSAIAERLRLQEEWSSLKGTEDENEPQSKVKRKQTIYSKKLQMSNKKHTWNSASKRNKENARPSDALRGVVALVDVGAEGRALALRAALAALGATVVPAWSPLVTHLVWSQGGSRDTRSRARALACRVVSPLWVEACASSARRVSEKVFPSTARDSDLPSPGTLCRLLKTAEKENWLIPGLQEIQSDSEDDGRQMRLRISSDQDDCSKDGRAKESVDPAIRVNTAPRRALPVSISPPPAHPSSRRKLFTARPDGDDDSDAEDTQVPIKKTKTQPKKALHRPDKTRPEKEGGRVPKAPERQKKKKYNLTQEQKRNLENAGRLARKLAEAGREGTQTQRRIPPSVPRIVFSGMSKSQYQAILTAVQTLKGIVQKNVDHCTTHVLLGSCKEDGVTNEDRPQEKSNTPMKRNSKSTGNTVKPFSICNQCNSPEGLVMKMFECDNVEVTDHCSNPNNICDKDVTIICSTVNRNNVDNDENVISEVPNNDISDVCNGITNDKRLRTLKTLLGAARGCRVLHAQWALDSLKEKKWLPHIGYEVTYLLKVAQKARVERYAIEKIRSEYGYNVFRGIRVCLTQTAHQRDAAMQLLSLCGADIVHEDDVQYNNNAGDKATQNGVRTQNGGFTQNGGYTQDGGLTQYGVDNCDTVVIGKGDDEVSSKWVFDSVAAGRPRTIRRYINKNIASLQG